MKEGRAKSFTQTSYSASSNCSDIHLWAVAKSMPSGMTKTRRKPSMLGVTCTSKILSKTAGFFTLSSSLFSSQYPLGSGMWSLS